MYTYIELYFKDRLDDITYLVKQVLIIVERYRSSKLIKQMLEMFKLTLAVLFNKL